MELAKEKILSICQEGTVREYSDEFQFLFDQVKNCEEISEYYAIYLFISGLEPGIRDVFITWHQYSLHTLKDTISLALKLNSNKLKDSFSPYDPKSSLYDAFKVFGVNDSREDGMVMDNDVLKDNKTAFRVFDEMPNSFCDEIQRYIETDEMPNMFEIASVCKKGFGTLDLSIQAFMGSYDSNEDEKDDKDDQVPIVFSNDSFENDQHEGDTLKRIKSIQTGIGDQEILIMKSGHLLLPNVAVINKQEIEFMTKSVYGRLSSSLQLDQQVKLGEHVGVLGLRKEFGLLKRKKRLNWFDTGWVCNMECEEGESMKFKLVLELVNKNKVCYMECKEGESMKSKLVLELVNKNKVWKVGEHHARKFVQSANFGQVLFTVGLVVQKAEPILLGHKGLCLWSKEVQTKLLDYPTVKEMVVGITHFLISDQSIFGQIITEAMGRIYYDVFKSSLQLVFLMSECCLEMKVYMWLKWKYKVLIAKWLWHKWKNRLMFVIVIIHECSYSDLILLIHEVKMTA